MKALRPIPTKMMSGNTFLGRLHIMTQRNTRSGNMRLRQRSRIICVAMTGRRRMKFEPDERQHGRPGQTPHVPEPHHARRHEHEQGATPRTVHTETPHEYTTLGPAGGKFDQKAPAVMRALQRDYGLTPEQAAGAVGNLGEESGGFKQLQEVNPTVRGSRGGYGWAQWTGSRRRDFEKYVAENHLDPTSDAANYGFMRHELDTNPDYMRTIPAMRGAKSVDEAVHTWMKLYEQPGKPAENIRRNYAHRALAGL